MTPTPSTPYSRDLGDELRHLREKHTSYTGTEMGYVLGWHQTKVSNVENGKVRASEIDIVQYLTTCKRSRTFAEQFLNRYRRAFDAYFVQVPENLRTLVFAEGSATKITSYDQTFIHGLLQTEDYARALFRQRGLIPEDKIESFVQFRIQRQAILQREHRPDCTFYLHEQALMLQVGGARVMEEQISRLLFKTHAIRIVPASTGERGAIGGSYTLWEYEKDRPVAFAETLIGQLFAQSVEAVARSKDLFNHLDEIALDEGQSRSLLMQYLSRPREDPDDPGAHVAQEQLQRWHA
ncbi:helix-turn-helix domain-containing protein [Lentzea tibetensis]|uniref:Helix-turn-helix domain-containing protein n=1 Tax=Lentzea tibetensis TaxID=2591470 RepID=A0A563EQ05_9PSEU|nr:helix-turn-helix transcriptional regulator [Lentzea tibetensis]TWP48841.1 helix-turn-helix domain-containing protein [Lentzea tibetensis]